MGIPTMRCVARVLEIRLYNRLPERRFSSFSRLQFLVDECGIPLKPDSPLAQKLQFEEKTSSKVKSVIAFFKSHEFSEAEIAMLISKLPRILHSRIASNLNPKLQYLIERGFEGSLLRRIVLANPVIFRSSLRSTINRAVGFLKTVLESDESVRVAIRRAPYLLTSKIERRMKPNIDYLAKQGMPNSRIMKFVRYQPRTLLQNIDKMVNQVEKVKEYGVMPQVPMFMYLLRVISRSTELTLKRKGKILKSLGWSDEDVISTFVKQPTCLNISEEKLRMTMYFFVNCMGIPQEQIIAYPVLLTYSLKERIRPRYDIVKILEAKKLLCRWSIRTLLTSTEEGFIRRYITKHLNQVPSLLETYHRSKKSGNWCSKV